MESLSYDEDPRLACKYGKNCYQTNPAHLNKYKHPTTQKRNGEGKLNAEGNKKLKLDNTACVEDVKFQEQVKPKGESTSDKTDTSTESKTPRKECSKEEISEFSDSEPDCTSPKECTTVRSSREDCPTKQTCRETISESSDSDQGAQSPTSKDTSVCSMQQAAAPTGESLAKTKRTVIDTVSESSDSETESKTTVEAEESTDRNKQRKELIADRSVLTGPSQRQGDSPESKTLQRETEPQVLRTGSGEMCNKLMKELFLVEMPKDFFSFWEFCKFLATNNPSSALKSVGLLLVGPFDVMAGKFDCYQQKDSNLSLTHWRYYYDPPEFQTVLKGDDKTLYHIGYFRDEPGKPGFLAQNSAAKSCAITPMARNIFGAVNYYLENSKKISNPFQKVPIANVQKALQSWAKKEHFELDEMSMKNRQSKIVSKTFHGAGIVVPVQKKTELGYRELLETDAKLKKILKLIVESENEAERDLSLEKLQPIITAANIANDECDFGTSLELGIDLFSFGGKALHRSALQLLRTAYTLLGRPEFAQIIQAHLQRRIKGANLSVLNDK